MATEPSIVNMVSLPDENFALAQHVQTVAEQLLNASAAPISLGVRRAEFVPDYNAESGPFLLAILALRPAEGVGPRPVPTLVRLRLAIEVSDGGPSRIKIPTVGAGTEAVAKRSLVQSYEPCGIDELDALPQGAWVTISTRITGTPDEQLLDLSAEDRAILKPAIAALYPAPTIVQLPAVDNPVNKRQGPTLPTMGF